MSVLLSFRDCDREASCLRVCSCEPQGDSQCVCREHRYPELPVVYRWRRRHRRGEGRFFVRILKMSKNSFLFLPLRTSWFSSLGCRWHCSRPEFQSQANSTVCVSDKWQIWKLCVQRLGKSEGVAHWQNRYAASLSCRLWIRRSQSNQTKLSLLVCRQVCPSTGRVSHILPSTQNQKQSKKVTNFLYTVLPLVSLPHTISGTEMDTSCPQVLLTHSR